MMALGDKIELHTFGKFSPFTAGNVVNHGFETDKRKLMSALNQMDALVFSSRVDNYPLILCEALSIGVSEFFCQQSLMAEMSWSFTITVSSA